MAENSVQIAKPTKKAATHLKPTLSIATEESKDLSLGASKNSPTAARGTLANPNFSPDFSPQKDSLNLPACPRLPQSKESLHKHSQSRSTPSLLHQPMKRSLKHSQTMSTLNHKISESLNIETLYSEDSAGEHQYRQHLSQMFQSLNFIRTMPSVDPHLIRQKRVCLPKRVGFETKKTIIFDLDETLVHCLEAADVSAEVVLPISMPNGEVLRARINIRPFARECLAEASKNFEVILFTASHQAYADAVIDFLDPCREYVHHRLYRNHCMQVQGVFVKDLRILTGRKFQDIVLVDNSVHSFGCQLENGIPIVSWHNDYSDKELLHLLEFLKVLKEVEDVREPIRQTFNLTKFYREYMSKKS